MASKSLKRRNYLTAAGIFIGVLGICILSWQISSFTYIASLSQLLVFMVSMVDSVSREGSHYV